MKVIIVGAGLTGLTAAYELKKNGHEVTLLERDSYVGGLSASVCLDGAWIERYYHHIFKSDTHVISLIDELGLSDRLLWKETPMGFHTRNGNHAFGTPINLLKYPGLGLLDKLRFGLIILNMKFTKDWKQLDTVSAKSWLIWHGGDGLYRKIWKPLLKVKFGSKLGRASAAWLWGRINPRANSRSSSMFKEILGYVDGSFQVMMDALAEYVGDVRLRVKAEKILTKNGIVVGVKTSDGVIDADAVLYTGSVPELSSIVRLPKDYVSGLADIDYQAVACTLIKTGKPLGDFYWLNNGDEHLELGGVIEHTNFIPPEAYGGHLVYSFMYLDSNDRVLADEDKLKSMFLNGLKKVYPEFNEDDITSQNIYTARYATPVYDIGFLNKMPDLETPVAGLYIAGMTSVYPMDRNMDGAVKVGLQAAKIINGNG